MSNVNNSIDPADDETLTGAFRFIVSKMLQDSNGMLPAKVIAVSEDRKRVQVQPLIAVLSSDGSQISRSQIASIPVMQLGAGGFFISFPLAEGSLGWILANDRDISLFLQSYSEARPNTLRKNNFADSIFIPDIMTGYTIAEEDSGNAVLQNLDGTVKVSLWPNKIKYSAPLHEFYGQVIFNDSIEAKQGISTSGGSGTPINIEGNLNMTGNMFVDGNIEATGDITPHV